MTKQINLEFECASLLSLVKTSLSFRHFEYRSVGILLYHSMSFSTEECIVINQQAVD